MHIPGVLGEAGTGEPRMPLMHSLCVQEEFTSYTPVFSDIISLSFCLC